MPTGVDLVLWPSWRGVKLAQSIHSETKACSIMCSSLSEKGPGQLCYLGGRMDTRQNHLMLTTKAVALPSVEMLTIMDAQLLQC